MLLLKARARVFAKKKRREVVFSLLRAFYESRIIDRVFACSNTTGRLIIIIIIIIVVEAFRCGKETRFENAGDDAIDDADADADGRGGGVWSESQYHHKRRRRRNVDSSDHV